VERPRQAPDRGHVQIRRTDDVAPAATLVIFDCDGVLVDSEVVAARVLARELTAIGLPLTVDDCRARYTGISMGSVVDRIEEEWGRALPADFVERVRAADAEAFRAELRPVAGVREVVEALAQPKCVASSGRLAKMRLTLSLTGLLPFFEPYLFSAEMVARGKPAPDLFLFAAERMSFAPARCVVIEDSQAGVSAAVAAGMQVLGFAGASHCAPGYDALLRVAGAPLVFTRMAELPRLLERVVLA
jgi:HAD superfamily hydrolase (TIGR01509 family)